MLENVTTWPTLLFLWCWNCLLLIQEGDLLSFSTMLTFSNHSLFSFSSNPHRDLVHRQTACWAVKHMALGVYGFGCEDALTHLMNYVWPNVFETAPHMMQSFHDASDGFRVSVGPIRVLQYTLQVRGWGGGETQGRVTGQPLTL